jgi:hypothetical protein
VSFHLGKLLIQQKLHTYLQHCRTIVDQIRRYVPRGADHGTRCRSLVVRIKEHKQADFRMSLWGMLICDKTQ